MDGVEQFPPLKLWVCIGVGVGGGVGVVVGVGVGVWVGSWLGVGAWVVIGSCGFWVGVGSCVAMGSLDVGSWLGMASLGSSSSGIGEVSWLGVVAHATRANAIAPTIDRASILLIIFCLIAHTPLNKFRFATYS